MVVASEILVSLTQKKDKKGVARKVKLQEEIWHKKQDRLQQARPSCHPRLRGLNTSILWSGAKPNRLVVHTPVHIILLFDVFSNSKLGSGDLCCDITDVRQLPHIPPSIKELHCYRGPPLVGTMIDQCLAQWVGQVWQQDSPTSSVKIWGVNIDQAMTARNTNGHVSCLNSKWWIDPRSGVGQPLTTETSSKLWSSWQCSSDEDAFPAFPKLDPQLE